MSGEVGKGFARRVTGTNLAKFAPLLRDRTGESNPQPTSDENAQAKPQAGTSTNELDAVQSLFNGSRVRVALPFTPPRRPSGSTQRTGISSGESGSKEEEDKDVLRVYYPVLVAEIPGPGRWTQASFSWNVFSTFFGAGDIALTYLNAQGEAIQETSKPIVKKSRNYCYELGAAAGLDYPDKNVGRPIGVFLRSEPQQFEYVIVMPSDPGHPILVTFLANRWAGPAGRLRRVTTDLNTLVGIWPSAPLPLEIPDVSGS